MGNSFCFKMIGFWWWGGIIVVSGVFSFWYVNWIVCGWGILRVE